VDLSGLNQLFSSDPTYLSLPGERIGSGKFSDVSIVGTNASGARVVAVDARGADPVLTIFPFGGGKSCSTGPTATSANPLDFGVRSDVPPIVGYQERTDSGLLLHLITLDCKEGLPPLPDKNWPLSGTFDDPPGYLAIDSSANLTFLEPWKGKQTVVAPNTHNTRVVNDKQIWSIEGGKLVVRDMQLNMLAQYGANVTEFDFTPDSTARAAYVDATCAPDATPCGGDLYVVPDTLGEAKKVDSDACHVIFPVRWGGLGVSYWSPCADHHPVVYGRATASSDALSTEARFVLGTSIAGSPDVDLMGDTVYAFYVETHGDPKAGNGTLRGGPLGQPAVDIAERPARDGARSAPIIAKTGSAWRVEVDYDSKAGVGRLVTWSPDAGLTEVATNVGQISGSVAVVDYNGTIGNLVHISGSTISKPLARRVPVQRILVDTLGIAVVANYDGTHGDLMLAPAGTNDFEKVASGVSPDQLQDGTVAFLQSLSAIAYLHDFDTDTGVGVLGARLIETGDTFDVGIRASEWGEYGWPEPGILYVSPEGDAAGIWFARLR
jgi:hypothetical protein